MRNRIEDTIISKKDASGFEKRKKNRVGCSKLSLTMSAEDNIFPVLKSV